MEAQGSISRLAARLALQLQSKAIASIYQSLNLTLVRCNARALLSRARFQHSVGEAENVLCVCFSFFCFLFFVFCFLFFHVYASLFFLIIILDVSITSPLNPVTLLEAGVSATAAAQATEARKHQANDPKCSELGWVCVPMVVETYGAWGKEATAIISSVASRLATSTCRPKSTILHEIYGRLNLNLVCANATAILSRIAPPP